MTNQTEFAMRQSNGKMRATLHWHISTSNKPQLRISIALREKEVFHVKM